ncbi:DUF3574 domain-containing protein [Nitrososphaera sp.]|uniref:DUF3574 domain-containing protein n=1 Tax=Nitrososphaera sp. TaxID=1971748 RepID=UPI003459E176
MRYTTYKLGRSRAIKIDFYIPTRTRNGKEIDPDKVDRIVNQIWPKYQGATKLTGTGYYRPKSGKDEITDSYVLSIITTPDRTFNRHLRHFKQKIKEDLHQESVLITWHYVEVL